MQQLQFVELDEGGRLVVSAEDGTKFAVPVDDRLRSALRPRPRPGPSGRPGASSASPRDVQSMIRAGQTAEEVAGLTGWELERVRRFEGPVLAEREHVASLAQRAHVRAQGRTDGTHTLDRRVRERLQARGVELGDISWDAARHEAHGPWTVLVIFSAGGRERRAAWHYDVATRAIDALDDEARWLSEDEQALPGGLAGHPVLGASHSEDEAAADLMASMRERRQRRNRRPRKELGPHDPAHVPGQRSMPDEVLPLEDLHYDPDTMGDPPAAHPRAAEEHDEESADADREPETGSAGDPGVAGEDDARSAGRRQRRRLRMPKFAVEDPAPVEPDPEPDGAYARTLEPGEVSFDEFFGTDDELEDDGPDSDEPTSELADEGPGDEPAPELEGEEDAEELGPDDRDDSDDADDRDDDNDDDEADGAEPQADAGSSTVTKEPAPPKPAAPPRKGRTSVPSWDDIMFGSRDRG
ncbi:septation protein SepH [Ornithinimicrobium flavum]|uniref:septation protein SepH n=1 Tax=Ornithinimicrobium flavum TaxID=1288636 RepID=UPI00106F5BA6|nr:septation protein SepH [Ornithinimicrobium flavum]